MAPVDYTDRLPLGLYCIWCDKKLWRGERTKEHLKPLGLGGNNGALNIAHACSPCNNDRNRILNFKNNLDMLKARHDQLDVLSSRELALLRVSVLRATGKLSRMQCHRNEWVAKEKARIGWSPHENIEFVIPSLAEVEYALAWRESEPHPADEEDRRATISAIVRMTLRRAEWLERRPIVDAG